MKKTQKRKIGDVSGGDVATDERAYCICQAVSYGEMVACDGKVFFLFLDLVWHSAIIATLLLLDLSCNYHYLHLLANYLLISLLIASILHSPIHLFTLH